MAITRPTGEQLRFRSQYTGDHILDTYLESAEKGGRSVPDLLDDLFDSSGVFRDENFEFRFDPTADKLQFRVGNFASSTSGWTDITTFFNITGSFNAATTYQNFDVLTLTDKDVYIVHGLSSGTTFADESAVEASAYTTKLIDVSEAREWASKTDGQVRSTDYSSKAWAIGGTGVTNADGAAKEWAIKTSGTVDGTNYSAKYWATSTDVVTVSTNIADVNTVAGDITNVNTVATDIANVNTTATNISDVNTVAAEIGVGQDVTVTAANIASVNTVAADIANVNTTAGSIANVNTTAGSISNVNTVATNIADVNTVAPYVGTGNDITVVAAEITNNNLQTVAADIAAVITTANDLNEAVSEIDTVANSITNVDTVGTNIADVNTVAGSIANVNTTATDIANVNTVAGSITNVNLTGGSITNVNTVATDIANVNTTAAAIANVNTTATNIADVNTVAAEIGVGQDVTVVAANLSTTDTIGTVAGSIANVNLTGQSITNVNTVAGDIANVNTVAGSITNVNILAGINADVTTVAGIDTNVSIVAGVQSDVTTVSGIAGQVTTVSNISTNVTTVATNNANVTTVATDIANVNTTAGSIANVNTAATNIADINTVAAEIGVGQDVTVTAANIADVNTVATDITNVNTTAGSIANVNTVATNISNVNTVAGISANVTTVAGNTTNVNTVATNIADVNTVAGIAADVTTAATNVVDFNNRYLGPQASAPTLDPNGSALDLGDLYFDTTSNVIKVYGSAGWTTAASAVNGTSDRFKYTATVSQTTFTGADDNANTLGYDSGYLDVYLNGVRLVNGTDFTATNGTSIILTSGASANDILEVVAYGTFELANFSVGDANDVTIGGITDGQFLVWNGSSGIFEPGDVTDPTPAAVSDQDNTSTGYFDLPSGSSAQRPASPNVGYLRFNTDIGYTEQYTPSGWQAIAAPPQITSVSPTSFDGSSGTSFTISGSNFDGGAQVKFITSGGAEVNAGSVSIVNTSTITATTSRDFLVSEEPLSVKVINGTGLSTILSDVIDAGGVPSWTTASGTLGTFNAGSSINIQLSATDPDGQTVTYTISSGSLPSGVSMSSSGNITGTAPDLATQTSYNFIVTAEDSVGNSSTRSFTIVINATNYFGDGSDGAGSF